MARLTFDAADVRRVVEHSLAAPEQSPQITGYDRKTGRAITTPVESPAVILVHDQGVYLMSNGRPRDIVEGETSFAAYARSCDPRKDGEWWDAARNLVGGDDFAETLPWAVQLKDALDRGAKTIIINFGARQISFTAKVAA